MNLRRRSALAGLVALFLVPIGPQGVFGDIAWPSGPMEVHVALDQPVEPTAAAALVGRTIPYHELKEDGAFDPSAEPLGRLNIAGVKSTEGGRILVLATDPHPRQARYVLPLEGARARPDDRSEVHYTLTGASAAWFEGAEPESTPSWTAWLSLPEVGGLKSRAGDVGSGEYERWSNDVFKVGRLRFDVQTRLPAGKGVVTIESPRPIVECFVGDGVLEEEARKTEQGLWRADVPVSGDGASQPAFLSLTVETGPGPALQGAAEDRISYRFEPADGSGPVPILTDQSLLLPWVSTALADARPRPMEIPDLSGGDPAKGKEAFFSKEALCGQCHVVRGEGGRVGPDLTRIGRKGMEHLYRSIAVPSEEITPDFVTYTVSLKDGRVAAGIVRAEGADAVQVTDAEARPTTLPRDQIEDVRASATSLMPVGLLPVLGEARLRDIAAFLMATAGE